MTSRSFVEECDFITSPGHRSPDGRTRAERGLPGGGPTRIITDFGVLDFGSNGEATLAELYSGVSVEEVQAACGWNLCVASVLRSSPVPDAATLDLLRKKLDPSRLYL
jgi:glutaconate CoA-transferase subunit B